MPARAIGSGTISFGLVSIPIKLYTAAVSQTVRFNQLHEECGSRLKQQMICPVCDRTVDRGEIVKAYEYAKGQYVRFSEEELKQLEAEKTHALDVEEFVPLETVDLVQVDKSYYLGPDKGGDKAYKLFADAMERTGKVAVGRFWTRGKEQLVLVRPYREGLLLHYVYYADEVRDFGEVDLGGDVRYREGELELAQQLIDQLAVDRLEPEKFRDQWRDRVMEAVQQKVAGEEITAAPEAPAAQVIDLFEALKQSLDQAGPAAGRKKAAEAADEVPTGGRKATSSRAAGSSKTGSSKTASSKRAAKGGEESSIKPPRKAEPRRARSASRKKGSTSG